MRYLHKQRNKLQVLKINGNRFKETSEKDYKLRIIAYLSSLKYLDYELIEAKEKSRADQEFKTELEGTNLENEEQKDSAESKEALTALAEAHIHHTQNMFVEACKAHDQYEVISAFLKFPEVLQNSEGVIDEIVTMFQNTIKAKQREKKKILFFCKEKMTHAERSAEKDSIVKIEDYKRKEKHIFRKIKAEQELSKDSGRPVDYDSFENQLIELIFELKGALMDVEMAL